VHVAYRIFLGALVLVAISVVAAGCGSSSSSSSSSGSTASESSSSSSTVSSGEGESEGGASGAIEEKLEAALERPTQINIKTPLRGKIPSGKTIDWLECGAPVCAAETPTLKAATDALGWNLNVVNEGLDPETVKAAWDKAIEDEPDGMVVSGGFPVSIYKSELETMEERKTPMIAYGDPSIEPPPGYLAVVAGGEYQQDLMAPLKADWIAAKGGGDSKILFVYSSTLPVLVVQKEAFEKEIKKVCSGCETTYFDAPATSIGKNLANEVAQQVQAHPETTYIVGGYNDLMLGVPAALRSAGVEEGAIKLITHNQDSSLLQEIGNGEVEMTIVQPLGETMWQSVDILLRHMLGMSIAESSSLSAYATWIVNQENLPEKSELTPYLKTVPDFEAQFKKLWGIG
jgi:ribose transport system substrate-binding protein